MYLRKNVLSLLLLSLCLASACSSDMPSEEDAMKALNAKNAKLFKVKNLRKTNGTAMEMGGLKTYKMDYEAEIECTSVNATRATGGMPGMVFGLTPAKCYEIGETQKINGSISFEKAEQGWRAVGL